jgi:hypothetical protein
MFNEKVTLELNSDSIIIQEQQKEITNLNIKLSAFYKFFMAINPD